MGKISRRPMIILSARTIVEKSENALKFPMGPTMSRPGPTLLMAARDAVKVVVKEKPSRETIRLVIKRIKI